MLHKRTIVAVKMLNCCVRYGYRCVHLAITTGFFFSLSSHSKLNITTPTFSLWFFFLWLSPRPISISPLHVSLHFHFWPISLSSSRGLTTCVGKSHLEGDFTLRCLQRLFLPHVATQLCHWRDNWCTIGVSIPVLSY